MTRTASPESHRDEAGPKTHWFAYAIIWIATFAVGGLGGLVSGGESDPWYVQLDKAPGTPPGWTFGVVWPILYILMALGASLAWSRVRDDAHKRSLAYLYGAQLIVNLAWSYLFFGMHLAALALVDIAALLALVLLMTRAFWRSRRIAGVLQIPYLLWLCFAFYLNTWIVFAN